MFKIFPATLMPNDKGGLDKVPLVKGWQEKATDEPETIEIWKNLFRDRIKFWGVPCGPTNDLFVLDADVKTGGLETLKTVVIPATMSQRTMSGGIHYFFRYPKDGKHYGNRVGFMPGLDTRGVGGWVAYYGTDATPIAEAPAWLLEAVGTDPSAPAVQGSAVRVSPEIAQAIIEKSLETIREAPEGESNNVLNIESFRLGQLVASESITLEYAEQALFRAAKERGKPDYEARATIASGLAGGAKKPLTSPFGDSQPVPGFTIPAPPVIERWTPQNFTRQDLLNTSNLRKPQLFENWSTEDIHIVTADGGTGKTTLTLFEAVCLALGDRFLGFNCLQTGRTLYITGEDTAPKLGAMIGQILRQMGYLENFPGFAEKVETVLQSIVVKKDADLCLIVKDRQNFIHPNPEAMRKILEAVDDVKPKFIVFDPISSFWGSESALNDMNKAVTKFMSELAERSGACVQMINHMGKSSSANKDMSQFAGRGGSGLPSNARVSRVLRPIFEEEYMELTGEQMTEKQSAMMCVVNKFTDGSPLYNKPFLILRDGYIFSRKNLTADKAKEQEKSLSDIERVFAFVKDARSHDRFPSELVIVAHFMTCGNPISEARTKRAIKMISYAGHMGEMFKFVDNPDLTSKEKVIVITDMDGKEL